MSEPGAYRFGDASRPGLLLGLAGRQVIPLVAGIVVLAVVLQTPLPPLIGVVGPVLGSVIAFGRWRGLPIVETALPGGRLLSRRLSGRRRWLRTSLIGDNTADTLPVQLRGLELLELGDWFGGVVCDRAAGTVTAVIRVHGEGFALAAGVEQDQMLAGWGAALSPFAREGSPVRHVVWQEWAHPDTSDTHRRFLNETGTAERNDEPAVADYLELVESQAPTSIVHDVLVAVTVDERRVRGRRGSRSPLELSVDALADELRLLTARLEAGGLTVEQPLSGLEVAAAVRTRSDPGRAAQVVTLSRSLAAAAGRGALEWGPMLVEPAWRHCRVDAAVHRCYRVAGWPRLPVGADWLSGLLADTQCVRTVTVVMEPVPIGRAARAADREVMAREADSELKQRKGFRVNARERKRLSDAERREHELSEGHAEFAFAGIVTVTAASLDELDDDCAHVEHAAAQCLLDLRPLDARHDQGWVASLPLGRTLAPRFGP